MQQQERRKYHQERREHRDQHTADHPRTIGHEPNRGRDDDRIEPSPCGNQTDRRTHEGWVVTSRQSQGPRKDGSNEPTRSQRSLVWTAALAAGWFMAPIFPTALGLTGDYYPTFVGTAIRLVTTRGWLGAII